jgi:hypothetical protein
MDQFFKEVIQLFSTSETPFALLFMILFIFYIRESRIREARQTRKYDQLQKEIQEQIGEVRNDLKTMLTIWKVFIDKELERRKE